MPMQNAVSIHIVTYNSENDIEDCLESVFRQTYPIRQVLVVDNASGDRTREILLRYRDRIGLIQNRENLGFAAAHNQAIRLSQSDFFLVLNPDVVLHPDYVRHQVAYMTEHPDVGSTTGKLLLRSAPHLVDSAGLMMTKARRAFDRGANEPAEKWDLPGEVFGVSGAAAFYRRKMAEEISADGQFFDEDFFAYKEDVDVAWRSRLLGWKAAYVPESIAFHERGWKKGTRAAQSVAIRRHSYINRYRMMVKNESLLFFMRDLPFILLYELAGLGYLVLKEPELLPAWLSFFKNLPRLVNKRKWVQTRKRVPFREVYRFIGRRLAEEGRF